MKFELGKQVLLLVGMAHREVVITGRAQYLRGADQYLVEDLDPDSQRGAFWVEEPGLIGKNAATGAADRRAERDARVARPRVDFTHAKRDWTPKPDAEPTSRGFYVGDRVIHPKHGGGVVIGNVNGHTEVRFYDEDKRQVFIGVTADELMLASMAEASLAQAQGGAHLIDKAIDDATADGATSGISEAVGSTLDELATGTIGTFDADLYRIYTEAMDRGYSINLSLHKPDEPQPLASDPTEV